MAPIPSEEMKFHSMDEIRAFIKQEVEKQLAAEKRKTKNWSLAKQGMWLLLLSGAYLQYYLLDIMYQSVTLPTLQVNLPAKQSTPSRRT
jgi:hypothetical protein